MKTLMLLTAMPAAALDHSAWDTLLKKYVNAESRVDYRAWKASPDLAALDQYLATVAGPWADSSPAETKSGLINAYNALTIRWILTHYPVESIWKTKKPFTQARHTVNGRATSLDAIETRLRAMGDPRIHAVLVCAARGCPPLRREAYVAERLESQLEANTREWLANPRLNVFDPKARVALVSSIFKWYGGDFPTLKAFLARYAPPGKGDFLESGKSKIDYLDYHWGLNDQGPTGEKYSGGLGFYFDYLRNR